MGHIAIVDDSMDTLEVLTVVLTNGHDFQTFKNGPEFLRRFHRNYFQLILLDLVMPEMDGFEVFERIRRVDQEVPVVAITAVAYNDERDRAFRVGFCDYFVKPILEIEQFKARIYSHIGECASPPVR